MLPERPRGGWPGLGGGGGGEIVTEAKRPGAKRLGGNVLGQKEISGRNGLGRNDSDFRRQDNNVFYPLQNQFKANA